jgi:SAM-dependent methyltransferase
MTTDAGSAQFSDRRLVAIFDIINSIEGYKGFYLDLARELAPRTILDIGCGTGLLTCELAKQGYHMVGVEPSAPLLVQARQRQGCENVEWIQGYVDKLNDVHGDLAIMTGHVAQFFLSDEAWQEALKSIHLALNLGGYVAFESRNPLIPPFAGWPTADAPATVVDPVVGSIGWWVELLRSEDRKVRYELHYHFLRTGEEVVSTDELIFRSRDEIVQSLSQAQFYVEQVFGDWDRSPVGEAHPEMIFIASRS